MTMRAIAASAAARIQPNRGSSSGIAVEARTVKPLNVAVCVSGFVTTTAAAPGEMFGTVAVSVPEFTNVTLVAALPRNVTVAPFWNAVPLIVTGTPGGDDGGAT